MKYFFILLFSLLLFKTNSQTIVSFHLKDNCKDSLVPLSWEIVDKNGDIMKIDSNVILIKGEEYFINANYFRNTNLKLINFSYRVPYREKVDTTIVIPVIAEFHEGNSVVDEIKYFCCDTLCQGQQEDYYKNGNKRIEGNFKCGQPIGKLIYYDKKGEITKIEKYNRKGRLKKVEEY